MTEDTEPVFEPSFTFDFDFNQEEEAPEPELAPPQLRIKKIDRYGVMTIGFSDRMVIPSNATTIVNATVFDISLEPVTESRTPLLGFTWETISFDESQLKIQLVFENAKYVSSDLEDLDLLKIKVKKPELFFSLQSYKITDTEEFQKRIV